MKFRPCIDIRKGRVTQIVGSSLSDKKGKSEAVTNFESDKGAGYFAEMYKNDGLTGGHVIMLGPGNEAAAMEAIKAYPGGLQIGGGINPKNAKKYLEAGASKVIVTSYVFKDGQIKFEKLQELIDAVGKERLVLDLSCRRRTIKGHSRFYVVTDRWQKFSNFEVNEENMRVLASKCSEFLVHGVDVEGKRQGVETELIELLGSVASIPVTYAGGIRSEQDLQIIEDLGRGRVDFTIGSALDIFGGTLPYKEVALRYSGPKKESKGEGGDTATCNNPRITTTTTTPTAAAHVQHNDSKRTTTRPGTAGTAGSASAEGERRSGEDAKAVGRDSLATGGGGGGGGARK